MVEGQDRAAHHAAETETKVLVPRTESSTLRSGKTSAAPAARKTEVLRAPPMTPPALCAGDCVFCGGAYAVWRLCVGEMRIWTRGRGRSRAAKRTCGWHAFGGRFSLASGSDGLGRGREGHLCPQWEQAMVTCRRDELCREIAPRWGCEARPPGAIRQRTAPISTR